MNDSIGWSVLIHRLPPKPDYFRVRVRRRLQQLGAVAVKNAVYVLPHSDQSIEDFEWLDQEIRRDGGDAIVAETRFVSGITDAELIAHFSTRVASAYQDLRGEAGDGLSLEAPARTQLIAKLERRMEQILAHDP